MIPLLQKNFKMKIVKDLGMLKATLTSKRLSRFAVFECSTCSVDFKADANRAKNKKQCLCKSCSQQTHGLRKDKSYVRWGNMKRRCYDTSHASYARYGGRGITVCEEWVEDFATYVKYINSLPNANVDSYTIDRIKNDEGYKPNNLRWASPETQAANKSIYVPTKSGIKGVVKSSKTKNFEVFVTHDGIKHYLGSVRDKEEGLAIRQKYIIENNLPHTRVLI